MKELFADQQGLNKAASIIRAGGLIAFPTETYYGLAVDPFNERALARLFAAKKRPAQKAILLLVADREQLFQLIQGVPADYEKIMEKFWPGPLTLIFRAKANLPMLLTAGTGTVGVRMSSHPLAMRLVETVGGPITATSANVSGMHSTSMVDEVKAQLEGLIDAVLVGGKTEGVGSSTIIGLFNGKLRVVREGVLPFRDIQQAVGDDLFELP